MSSSPTRAERRAAGHRVPWLPEELDFLIEGRCPVPGCSGLEGWTGGFMDCLGKPGVILGCTVCGSSGGSSGGRIARILQTEPVFTPGRGRQGR